MTTRVPLRRVVIVASAVLGLLLLAGAVREARELRRDQVRSGVGEIRSAGYRRLGQGEFDAKTMLLLCGQRSTGSLPTDEQGRFCVELAPNGFTPWPWATPTPTYEMVQKALVGHRVRIRWAERTPDGGSVGISAQVLG